MASHRDLSEWGAVFSDPILANSALDRFAHREGILYADDLDAGAKRVRAQEVLRKSIEAGTAVLSTQVLQEYFVAATRKMGVEVGAARRKVEVLSRLDMVIVQPDLILAAIDLHRLHAISRLGAPGILLDWLRALRDLLLLSGGAVGRMLVGAYYSLFIA